MTIYKYELKVGSGLNQLFIPEDAEVLTAQAQHGLPVVWVRMDPATHPAKWSQRRIYIYLTGGDGPRPGQRYLGTCQLHGGDFVVHVFEEK